MFMLHVCKQKIYKINYNPQDFRLRLSNIRYIVPILLLSNGRKEGNVLFNDAINTFCLRLYGVRHMVKDHSDSEIPTRCRHIDYSFRLTARVLLHAPSQTG